jgi:hypothetical protein
LARSRTARHALPIGLALSVVVHALLVWWNPGVDQTLEQRARTPESRAVLWRTVVVNPVLTEAASSSHDALVVDGGAARNAFDASTSHDSDAVRADPPAARTSTAAERLRYRSSRFWAPLDSTFETFEACRQREYAARLDSLVKLPPAAGEPALANAAEIRPPQAGIRIPFGRKPPGPAQVVAPPPLPDSLRRVTEPPVVSARVIRRAPGCADPVAADSLRR